MIFLSCEDQTVLFYITVIARWLFSVTFKSLHSPVVIITISDVTNSRALILKCQPVRHFKA